jgi:hypothetical protein
VDEVEVQPINLGQELGEAIELGLEAPPVVAALPVVDQRSGAYGVVFAIADSDLSIGTLGARAATITSLLMLGVPETRAIALVGDQP